ncbi:hypothetical protein FB451DRAFT_152334 [Mycena latifolia]|nr:hypothetical protein FB451DRAFT_152334 [Mycena latifolia]
MALRIRRNKACGNCRRRKIRCNGNRPCCFQCRLLPADSATPCEYLAVDSNATRQTSRGMLQHIQTLQARIEELEHLRDGAERAPQILLRQPYHSDRDSSSPTEPTFGSPAIEVSSPIPDSNSYLQEPPMDVLATLINGFLERFSRSAFLFLNPRELCGTALLPLPFGHPNRPSRALLSTIYLWGCVLSPTTPIGSYTEDMFLNSALRTLPHDIAEFALNPHLVLQTIQAEVLLSYYYLHSPRPVEGRYHSATAMSLALDAGLHMLGSSWQPCRDREACPPFPLVQTLLPPAADHEQVTERINAFWAVSILNNYWVAVQGTYSAFPHSLVIDTPWPGDIEGVETISRFLDGQDRENFNPSALLAKASTLLERICAFSVRTTAPPEPLVLALFAERLQEFQSHLPPLSGDSTLLVTHVLTDLTIVRLHASPYFSTSETIRLPSLAAAGRIVSALGGLRANDAPYNIDPILGPVCETIYHFYLDELTGSHAGGNNGGRRTQYQEIEAQLTTLMDIMSSLAVRSPVAQHCLTNIGHAYDHVRPASKSRYVNLSSTVDLVACDSYFALCFGV